MNALSMGLRVDWPEHDGARAARPSAFAKASADKTPSRGRMVEQFAGYGRSRKASVTWCRLVKVKIISRG